MEENKEHSKVAIIGLSLRVPGANSTEEFWANLRDARESITLLSDDELINVGATPEMLRDPRYVKSHRPIKDCELFDAEFFGFKPKEAETCDPQQRIFMECSWEALEVAGIDPTRVGKIGVFAGQGANMYLTNESDWKPYRSLGTLQLRIGNEKDHLPMRVSYKLGLSGPSIAVQTACSSSLAAIHLACRSLLAGDCDLALAGGVRIALPQGRGYLYQSGGIASPDGRCRAFDAKAAGTVGGNGAGVVLLKKLSEAVRDRDHIRAVVCGSAINNDGARKVGYTAPSVEGQASVIREALNVSGVTPADIGYVEAHGTGTYLGDPIEVKALTLAFGTNPAHHCGIGSVKTNVGHLDAAAGVVGVIKTVLALEHHQIPPSLNYETANPTIAFETTPFYVVDRLQPWETRHGTRRAGVSSFGIGGTNVHLILEEAPLVERREDAPTTYHVLPLSAHCETSLERMATRLADHIVSHENVTIHDVAHTLQKGRRSFNHRRAVVVRDRDSTVNFLRDPTTGYTGSTAQPARVAFLFSGQGTQFPNMGLGLYQKYEAFRSALDKCALILQPSLGIDIRTVLYPDSSKKDQATRLLSETWLTQPALFAVEYSLGQLWKEWGVTPSAVLGHSLGEYVAAHYSGIITLQDAARIVVERGRLMHSTPMGGMLAVGKPSSALMQFLTHNVDIAAINSKSQTVLSGDLGTLQRLHTTLTDAGVQVRWISTQYAFHSPAMDDIQDKFLKVLRDIPFSEPKLPILSNLTGGWAAPNQMSHGDYWVEQLRRPVMFSSQLSSLAEAGTWIFLEVGPGNTLASFARREIPGCVALHSLDSRQSDDPEQMVDSMARLWVEGASIVWPPIDAGATIDLPPYPFEKKRYWIQQTDSITGSDSSTLIPDEKNLYLSPPDVETLGLAGQGAEMTTTMAARVVQKQLDTFSELTTLQLQALARH